MDKQTFTLAEFREAQRDGFEAGAQFAACRASGTGWVSGDDVLAFQKEAERRYPQPTKPRVVTINGYAYRLNGGILEARYCSSGWVGGWSRMPFSADGIRTLADLLAHPTEPSDE